MTKKRRQFETLENRVLLACDTLPHTRTVRGIDVEFDQCYQQDFEAEGIAWEINVYYTEQNSQTNQDQCTGDDAADGNSDGVPDRCEHALPNVDNGAGDNVEAVAMANEVEDVVEFYLARNLDFVPSGEDEIDVYIAEDPRGGGITGSRGLYVDDELSADPDDLWKRLLAIHEIQHMVQKEYDSGVSWSAYGEGVARAVEDRYDATMDSDTGHLFINQVNRVLGNSVFNGDTGDRIRETDMQTLSYDNVLWWTWFMDQYRNGAGVDAPPTNANDIGWGAIREFYEKIEAGDDSNEFGELRDYIASQGSSFRDDFIDYTLAMYAYKYNPSDPRLSFIDAEIQTNGNTLSGHQTHSGGPAFTTDALSMDPRTSEYWEFSPASQCDFTAFEFDGNGKQYGFSIMTVDGGNLQDRWTSYSSGWTRTVKTDDLDRVVGVASAVDNSGVVEVGHGCVEPTLDIRSPSTSAHKMVGRANNPRTFIARIDVDGQDGSAVSGLTADAFDVSLRLTTDGAGGVEIPAEVINASYVQEDYWLLVQAPDDADGAQTGEFYDLIVSLGDETDVELSSILYVEKTSDVMLVLDRSGSMGGGTGKMEAAKNAANLLVDELADDDQGGFVAFDTDADLRVGLEQLSVGNQRADLHTAINSEMPLDLTSIGDGMARAATEHDAEGEAINACSFVLLSDGMQNEPQLWADVEANVVDNGCEIHTIALGPGTDQALMQQIAGASPVGGSYYYATNTGAVPVNSTIGWENNLSRIYDAIASEAAGRERILTAISESATGGAIGGMADFDDLPNGATYSTGDTFSSRSVEITGKPFFLAPGQTTSGRARVEDLLEIGSQQDVFTSNILLDFDFGGDVRELSLLFGEFGGIVNLEVNGDLRIVRSLTELNGSEVGGAKIVVEEVKDQFRLIVIGEISQFAVGGQEFAVDEVRFQGAGRIQIPVDDSSDELVVAIGWQDKDFGHQSQLFAPDGSPVPVAFRQVSTEGTNDVWRVPAPVVGTYQLGVRDLQQEFFVSATAISRYELNTFIGTPLADRFQGTEVPILASFTGNSDPVLGANVQTVVTAPDGHRETVRLYDDGNHGDSEPNDGVYGNIYYATSLTGVNAPAPGEVVEGSEPSAVGSYILNTVARKDEIRREAQDSFVIRPDRDSDFDGITDRWEEEHGLDPKSREDADSDEDMDGLSARCEFQLGTDPNNSDTDGGGESDGSESPAPEKGRCRVTGQNPNDPSDDRVRPLASVVARPEATADGIPFIQVSIATQQRPTSMVLMRRAFDANGRLVQDWVTLDQDLRELEYTDRRVEDGLRYVYKVMPNYEVNEKTQSVVDFDELKEGTVLQVGDSFSQSGIRVVGEEYFLSPTSTTADGNARITDVLQEGTANDAFMGNLNLRFVYDGVASEVSFLFGELGGSQNLQVNGELVITKTLTELDGKVVGGAKIAVEKINDEFRLLIVGEIKTFAVGGQEFAVDDVAICRNASTRVQGGNVLTPQVEATKDPYSPEGWVQINGGELTTPSRVVTLNLTASDNQRDGHEEGEIVQGTPNKDLRVLISTEPTFSEVRPVPFEPSMEFELPELDPGATAAVYVRILDAEGNVNQSQIFDSIRYEPNVTLRGDMDLNGQVDATDIDLLFAAIDGLQPAGNPDLDEDGDVDKADVDILVQEILNTNYGDANLDGNVGFDDFLELSANFGKPGGWADGNFDGDDSIRFADFLLLSANFGKKRA